MKSRAIEKLNDENGKRNQTYCVALKPIEWNARASMKNESMGRLWFLRSIVL